jgi:hypothetical protein
MADRVCIVRAVENASMTRNAAAAMQSLRATRDGQDRQGVAAAREVADIRRRTSVDLAIVANHNKQLSLKIKSFLRVE